MKCPNCKSKNLQVEEWKEEIFIYNDPEDYKAVENVEYNNSIYPDDSIYIIYCIDCGSIFNYEFEDGIGEERKVPKLK